MINRDRGSNIPQDLSQCRITVGRGRVLMGQSMNNLGIRVYGFAAIMLGLVGLTWADFALVWQPVPIGIPGRTALAYATGAILVVGGAAINWRKTAGLGAATLTILSALNVFLLQLPLVGTHPFRVGPWGGVAEQLALAAAGLIAYVSAAAISPTLAERYSSIGRIIFSLCAVMFGVVHFRYASDTAAMVPKYLPPDQLFWAYATGIAHIAAGLAILSGIQARLAAILLTVMFAAFGILVHAPLLASGLHSHLNWTMNAVNLWLTGAAWIVADSIRAKSEAAKPVNA